MCSIYVSHKYHMFIFQGGMCSIFVAEEDKVVNVACEHLEPVMPSKGDKVSQNRVRTESEQSQNRVRTESE